MSAKVSVSTGGEGAQSSDRLENGVLEVSLDGKKWEKVASFKDGKAAGTAPAGTKHIRIVVTAPHSKWLIVREIVVDVDGSH